LIYEISGKAFVWPHTNFDFPQASHTRKVMSLKRKKVTLLIENCDF
jgi:hypothetical protein